MVDESLADRVRSQLQKDEVVVRDKKSGQENQLLNGQEAVFAMIAQDMISIADKFERDIDEVHKLFYQVSCNRDKLIKILQQSGDKS